MRIENNKIVEATKNELHSYWLDQWSDLMSFDEYLTKMKYSGVIIHDKINRKDDDIDNLLKEIGNYWKAHSDLRFGEMITDVVESDLEWLEDDEILKLFHKN